jgi:hypothetical protein
MWHLEARTESGSVAPLFDTGAVNVEFSSQQPLMKQICALFGACLRQDLWLNATLDVQVEF